MIRSWICSRGHSWEDDVTVADSAGAVRCTVCGELGEPNPGATSGIDDSPGNRPTVSELENFVRPRHNLPSIPGFEVQGRLGEGGMGTVFKARHLRLGRVVALKVIRDASRSERLRVRFQIEAESLASLSHPNIVQIFEVGEFEDHPYIALEFVDGGSLRERLRTRHPRPREAAELIATLARAMHAAHERGIVHRDLKPDNILLTADGTPKITDFGVAKRLVEDKARTATGVAIGTPAYMAPEQAAGDSNAITPLVDVFALGVILYEVLTGRIPFDAPTAGSLLERLKREEPAPPSRIEANVPRDLEVICLKCLEKTPARRYSSAAALANDLDRFLRDEPIEARPASRYVRTVKWMRRNPTTAALIIASGLFLIVLAGLAAWSYREVSGSRQQAEGHLRLARNMLDDMYAKVTENWFDDDSQKDPLLQDFLEKTCKFYEEIAKEDGRDRELRRAQAMAYFRVGEIYYKLGKGAAAQEPFDRAIDMQKQLVQDDLADLAAMQELAKSYAKRGEWRWETKQPATDAERDFREARGAFERLKDQQPEQDDHIWFLGRVRYNLGLIAENAGRPEIAEKEFDQAIQFLEPLSAKYPERVDYRHDLARSHNNRGARYKDKGPKFFDKAEADYRRAIKLLQPRNGEEVKVALMIDLEVARQNLGNLFLSKGETDAALEILEEARGHLEKLTSEFPKRRSYQKKLATTHNSLGTAHIHAKDRATAVKHWERAREILDANVKELEIEQVQSKKQPTALAYRQELGVVLGNLGWSATKDEKWEEARKLVKQARDHLAAAAKPNPKDTVVRQHIVTQNRYLAEICLNLKDPQAAAAAARDMAETFGNRPQDWYYAACFQARALAMVTDRQAAEPILQQCLRSLSTALNTAGDPLMRLDNEAEVFAPLEATAEGQKLVKTLRGVPK
jgi:serine/threonine protein kinase